MGGRQHPFTVGLRQSVDGNDANTSSVVTAVSGSKAHTPPCLNLHVSILISKAWERDRNILEEVSLALGCLLSPPWH
jgi:hypothetical protein